MITKSKKKSIKYVYIIYVYDLINRISYINNKNFSRKNIFQKNKQINKIFLSDLNVFI